jgi:hypothetical protein
MHCITSTWRVSHEVQLEMWYVLKLNKDFHQWYSYYIRNVLILVLADWHNQFVHVHAYLISLSVYLWMCTQQIIVLKADAQTFTLFSFVNELVSTTQLVCNQCCRKSGKCSCVCSGIIQLTENCTELCIIYKPNCLTESPLKKLHKLYVKVEDV